MLSLLFLFNYLLEVERDLLVGELMVDSGKGIDLALNISLVLALQVNLKHPLSVNLDASALSSDFGGVNNILQDRILDSGEGTRTRTGSVAFLVTGERLSEDGTLGNNQNMASGKLLLEFPYKSGLDLVERFEKFEWNVQDNCLLAAAAIYVLGGRDVKVAKGRLELRRGHLKVKELLGNRCLELIGFLYLEK